MQTNIRKIFSSCFKEIGGEKNDDIRGLRKRPRQVTRDSFFEMAVWAVWVSGIRRKSAETFFENAKRLGFRWDFSKMSRWTGADWRHFIHRMHGTPCPPRAKKKWAAVRKITNMMATFRTEKEFQNSVFAGKAKSKDLDATDVIRILDLGLPFVGWANANYIIRNMGGDAIKCDRWLAAFMKFYNLSQKALESKLRALSISLSLFDLTIWAYCEMKVKEVSRFSGHFKTAFG